MYKRAISGAQLFQYVIIISLIALALVPIFMIFGGQIQLALSDMVSSYNNMNNSIGENLKTLDEKITAETLKAGELGGTSTVPVQKCVNSKCSIDYGEFILNGIPEDFNEYIQAGGNSGGTDKIAAILEKIAQQLENNGDAAGAEEFRNLANLQHYMASIQKQVENSANTCKDGGKACFIDAVKITEIPEFTPEISSLLQNVGSAKTINSLGQNFGYARYYKINEPDVFETQSKYMPNLVSMNIYDNIMANPKYSNTLKGVVTELYLSLADSSQYMAVTVDSMGGGIDSSLYSKDPLTGGDREKTTLYGKTKYLLNDITNPNISRLTDLDSALICVAGWNEDTGSTCHNPE